MLKLHRFFTLFVSIILSSMMIAQDDFGDDFGDEAEGSSEETQTVVLSGTVTDESGRALAGANVVVDGTELGSATDEQGSYTIEGVEVGSSITATVIGYEDMTSYADSETLDFVLVSMTIEMSALEVLASRAGENTAVAYTNISKEELNLRLGSRDIPLAMNTVPSVYATGQGGGAGDARINVRGFNQRNVAIMINGVPVNDMENGWVYWSNWDGVADATSSIQMQKGLSAQNLATPSIGGSMNVITDPTAQEKRGLFKQELGAYGFLKTTLSYHTGLLMDDKLALSATVVKKSGTGYYQGTWTDAWAYYFGASFTPSDAHRFEFYALGAPQRHGQNLYKQNIAVYDSEFAKNLTGNFGYDQDGLTKFNETGRDFNQNVSEISEASQAILDAGAGQHWQMYSIRDGVDRHESGTLSERENFFHKPQVALNHYWTIQDNMKLSSSLYWSGGMGGGTGTYGSVSRKPAVEGNNWWASAPWTWDWDAEILQNSTNLDSDGSAQSTGILRNSNNRQSTIGIISKLNYDVNNSLKTQLGIDYRSAEIYHVKTVRDLLGGEYYVNTDSDFDAEDQQKGLGDPIDYNFTNWVNWLGLFGQVEYNSGPLTGYGMAGMTTVKYAHQNHFKAAANYDYSYVTEKDGSGMDWVEAPGDEMGGNAGELYIEADPISTMQVKGGVMYDLGSAFSVLNIIPVVGKVYDNAKLWANFGLIDKAPIFDQVIQDWDAKMATDPTTENFNAFEIGLNVNSNDGTMAGKINFYSTTWSDRIQTKYVANLDGDDDIIYLTGIQQQHSGVETEFAAQLHPMVRADIGIGVGTWVFTDDAVGTYRDGEDDVEFNYALKDLKVGDSPQFTLSAGFTITPIEDATIQIVNRFYDLHHADWSPASREWSGDGVANRDHSWRAPGYNVLDIHAYYDLPIEFGSARPTIFVHVFNALDETYIQDATDNSKYNAWSNVHSASDAEVFFGTPMSFNVGLSVNF